MDKTVIEDDILDGIQVRLDNPNWDYIAESLVDVFGREATQEELDFAYAAHDRVRIRMETDDTEYVYRVVDKDGVPVAIGADNPRSYSDPRDSSATRDPAQQQHGPVELRVPRLDPRALPRSAGGRRLGGRVTKPIFTVRYSPDGWAKVRETPAASVAIDMLSERAQQDHQWGEQNHPDVSARAHAANYDIEARAWKATNDTRATEGLLSWDGILLEEAFEALEAAENGDEEALYTELVQTAAVATAWAEAVRRRQKARAA
jgi:hypothetical protein